MKWILGLIAVVGIITAIIFIVASLNVQKVIEPPNGNGTGDGGAQTEEKTYSSETHGVSFTYPGDYFLTERDPAQNHHAIIIIEDTPSNRDIVEGRGPATEGPTAITVDIYTAPSGQTLESWVRTSPQSNFHLSPDTNLISGELQGNPAFTYRWSGLYEGDSAVVLKNGKIYMFSGTYLTQEDRIRDDFIDVLQSVRFLP